MLNFSLQRLLVVTAAAALFLWFFLPGAKSGPTRPPTCIPLVDEMYAPSLLRELNAANSSIYAVIYLADADPNYPRGPVFSILKAISNAASRGVKTTVVIDHNIEFWKKNAGKDPVIKSENAYKWLKKNKVRVFLDDKERTTHSKLFIIDNRTVFIGSHNLTYSALKKNHEVSVMIQSEAFTEDLIRRLRKNIRDYPKNALPDFSPKLK